MRRGRHSRGEMIAFDAELIERVERIKNDVGFYPSLRMIAKTYDPPYSVTTIFLHLRTLSAEGKLSPDAAAVYKVKPHKAKTKVYQ